MCTQIRGHRTMEEKEYCQRCQQSAESCKHVFTKDFSLATILVVAYLFETFVQIILIVNCYRSLSDTSSNWLWILFIGWIVTSLLVTLISITWTFRGMDFSDRVCGQLLCYLMHLLLLGFLWRYLKIALAYEKPDVGEFFKLRTMQIYIQAFPLLVIHFSYLFTQNQDNLIVCMTVGELCCSIISLSLHPLSKSHLFDEPSNHKLKTPLTHEIKATIRILFIMSRMMVVGLLVSIPRYWPMLVIVAHLVTNFVWTFSTKIFISNRKSESINEWSECVIPSDKRRILKQSLGLSYALFWDVSVGGFIFSSLVPVLLVLAENVAVLIFHLRQCQDTILFVVVSGTCLALLLILISMTTLNEIYTHESKPVVDADRIQLNNNEKNICAILRHTLIEKFGSYELNSYLDKLNSQDINKQVINMGQDDNKVNNYERIDETLMSESVVKIQKSLNNEMNSNVLPDSSSSLSTFHLNPETELCATSPEITSTLPKNPSELKNEASTYQLKTPLVIRKASKIVLNKHYEVTSVSQNGLCKIHNNIYDKLIEDAYGILICEGERLEKQESSDHSTTPFGKKLRVLCAKCLENHDPLLSDCCVDSNSNPHRNHLLRQNNPPNKRVGHFYAPKPFDSPNNVYSETTEYPTESEFTCNMNDHDEEMSISTHLSTINNTYVNLPLQCNQIFTSASAMFPSAEVRKEFTGIEYVKAWLLMNDHITRPETSPFKNSNFKSKQINKPNQYRKSYPLICNLHLKPPPKQKQHPPNNNFITNETDNILFNILNNFHNSPIAHQQLRHLQNDLLETIV